LFQEKLAKIAYLAVKEKKQVIKVENITAPGLNFMIEPAWKVGFL